MKKTFLLCFILLVAVGPVWALDDVNDYPVVSNDKGLSGTFYVDSTQTLQRGEMQGGIYGIAFQNDSANYRRGTAEAVASAGFGWGMEGAVMVPYVVQTGSQNGLGDIKLAGKIHLTDQIEDEFPSLALAASLELPTGDQNHGLRTVTDYGADLLLIAQSKIELPDYTFNLMAEGGVFGQDINRTTQERHARFGGAGFFPIDDQWVLILEGIGTSGLGNSDDYVIASGSLRLFLKGVIVTGGVDKTIATGSNAVAGNSIHGSLNFPF